MPRYPPDVSDAEQAATKPALPSGGGSRAEARGDLAGANEARSSCLAVTNSCGRISGSVPSETT